MYGEEKAGHAAIKDRREQLKIKIKSLAAESRMIRVEEQKQLNVATPGRKAFRGSERAFRQAFLRYRDQKATVEIYKQLASQRRAQRNLARSKARAHRQPLAFNPLYQELHHHRTIDIRRESRSAHIAYGLIRGRSLEKLETAPKTPPDWKAIKRLCEKYGPPGGMAIPAPAP